MKITTRIKILLKKYLPSNTFSYIRKLYDVTFVKIIPIIFYFRARNFKKEIIVPLSYFGHDFSIIINPKNGFLDAQIYVYKKYETHILKEIMNHVHDGDTVIDIGANIGHHSLFMSRLVGENGKVVAFEPITYIREQFEKSIRLNNMKNIVVESVAIGEKESTEKIHFNEGSVASSSIVNSYGSNKGEDIHVVTLDSFSLTPSFIKLDIEGYELFALKGGEQTISRNRPVILMEYSPIYYRASNKTHSEEIISFFHKHNYDIYDIEDGMKKITDDNNFIYSFDEGLRSQTNIICVPKK